VKYLVAFGAPFTSTFSTLAVQAELDLWRVFLVAMMAGLGGLGGWGGNRVMKRRKSRKERE
jgi:hypothetical protein